RPTICTRHLCIGRINGASTPRHTPLASFGCGMARCWNDNHMSTLADHTMLVARALTRAKKDGLSFYELQQATRLAAEYLPGILHMLEQQGWVVSALVDGIQPPKRLWHLRKQAKETFGLCPLPVSHKEPRATTALFSSPDFEAAGLAGHLTGWQGALTPPSIAVSPSARLQLRRTPWIQNNSGLPQGPAGPVRCILSLR